MNSSLLTSKYWDLLEVYSIWFQQRTIRFEWTCGNFTTTAADTAAPTTCLWTHHVPNNSYFPRLSFSWYSAALYLSHLDRVAWQLITTASHKARVSASVMYIFTSFLPWVYLVEVHRWCCYFGLVRANCLSCVEQYDTHIIMHFVCSI